jgi:hypothetical protein
VRFLDVEGFLDVDDAPGPQDRGLDAIAADGPGVEQVRYPSADSELGTVQQHIKGAIFEGR